MSVERRVYVGSGSRARRWLSRDRRVKGYTASAPLIGLGSAPPSVRLVLQAFVAQTHNAPAAGKVQTQSRAAHSPGGQLAPVQR